MKVLLIGGTGVVSTESTQLALQRGLDLPPESGAEFFSFAERQNSQRRHPRSARRTGCIGRPFVGCGGAMDRLFSRGYRARYRALSRPDKAVHLHQFDNAKIKKLVPDFAPRMPYAQGIAKTIAWFEADASRRQIDESANKIWDKIIAGYEQGLRTAKKDLENVACRNLCGKLIPSLTPLI